MELDSKVIFETVTDVKIGVVKLIVKLDEELVVTVNPDCVDEYVPVVLRTEKESNPLVTSRGELVEEL